MSIIRLAPIEANGTADRVPEDFWFFPLDAPWYPNLTHLEEDMIIDSMVSPPKDPITVLTQEVLPVTLTR